MKSHQPLQDLSVMTSSPLSVAGVRLIGTPQKSDVVKSTVGGVVIAAHSRHCFLFFPSVLPDSWKSACSQHVKCLTNDVLTSLSISFSNVISGHLQGVRLPRSASCLRSAEETGGFWVSAFDILEMNLTHQAAHSAHRSAHWPIRGSQNNGPGVLPREVASVWGWTGESFRLSTVFRLASFRATDCSL